MGLTRAIEGATTSGFRQSHLRTEDAARETADTLRAVLAELQALNAQVAWQNRAIAADLQQRGVPLPR